MRADCQGTVPSIWTINVTLIVRLSENALEAICIDRRSNDLFPVSELSLVGVKRALNYPIDDPQPMENWEDCLVSQSVDFADFWASKWKQIVDATCQLRAERVLCNYFRELCLIVKGRVPRELWHAEWQTCCPPRAAHSLPILSPRKLVSTLCMLSRRSGPYKLFSFNLFATNGDYSQPTSDACCVLPTILVTQ